MSTLNQMGFVDENDNEAVYDLEDTAARNSISAIEAKIPSNASSSNKLATISDVSAAYKPKGNATLATLPSLTAEHLNWVYNMTEDFTTTSDFAEGAGKSVKAGNEVGIIDVSTTSTPNYKYTVLGGFIDTSGFQNKTLDTPITVDGTQKTTVETALQAINTLAANVKSAVGTLSSLTTTVKTSIVAAINELVTKKVSWTDAGKSVKKNYVKITRVGDTATINTVVFTIHRNNKGQVEYVNANGTNTGTGTAWFNVLKDNESIEIDNGDYILTGCPSGGGNLVYKITITSGGDSVQDFGEGANFTISNGKINTLSIGIGAGQTVDNLKFYPMLRPASIKDNSYEPYIPDNTELMTWEANGVLGAKNLLPNKGTSTTSDGITWTVNSDGTVTANGTKNASDSGYKTLDRTIHNYSLPTGNYIFSGNLSANCFMLLQATRSGSLVILGEINDNNPQVNVNILSTDILQCVLFINPNKTVSNAVFNPMLRLATDPDPTYAPYAMTNRELMDAVYKTTNTGSHYINMVVATIVPSNAKKPELFIPWHNPYKKSCTFGDNFKVFDRTGGSWNELAQSDKPDIINSICENGFYINLNLTNDLEANKPFTLKIQGDLIFG